MSENAFACPLCAQIVPQSKAQDHFATHDPQPSNIDMSRDLDQGRSYE